MVFSKDTMLDIIEYKAPTPTAPPTIGVDQIDQMVLGMWLDSFTQIPQEHSDLPPITLEALAVSVVVSAFRHVTNRLMFRPEDGSHDHDPMILRLMGHQDGTIFSIGARLGEDRIIKGYKPQQFVTRSEAWELQDTLNALTKDTDIVILALGVLAQEMADEEQHSIENTVDTLLQEENIKVFDRIRPEGTDHQAS